MSPLLEELLQGAYIAGASKAIIIPAGSILVEEELAARCRQPRCENYGLSMSCPPHVAGPVVLKKQLEQYEKALFFKIDVPSAILYSSDSREIFQLLHEIAAGIEQSAKNLGMENARAFAGDSCKRVFCSEHLECLVLSKMGECRHPLSARPSMSGFGINVAELLRCAGWEPLGRVDGSDAGTKGETFVCGLILLY